MGVVEHRVVRHHVFRAIEDQSNAIAAVGVVCDAIIDDLTGRDDGHAVDGVKHDVAVGHRGMVGVDAVRVVVRNTRAHGAAASTAVGVDIDAVVTVVAGDAAGDKTADRINAGADIIQYHAITNNARLFGRNARSTRGNTQLLINDIARIASLIAVDPVATPAADHAIAHGNIGKGAIDIEANARTWHAQKCKAIEVKSNITGQDRNAILAAHAREIGREIIGTRAGDADG